MNRNFHRTSYSTASSKRVVLLDMLNLRHNLPFKPISMCFGVVAILGVIYIGLVAVVMSYATLTVEFSQSVRNDESEIAILEEQYLTNVAQITAIDYSAAGYSLPAAKTFVQAKSATALR